jgi:hypothetical protein
LFISDVFLFQRVLLSYSQLLFMASVSTLNEIDATIGHSGLDGLTRFYRDSIQHDTRRCDDINVNSLLQR